MVNLAVNRKKSRIKLAVLSCGKISAQPYPSLCMQFFVKGKQ